MRRAPFACWVLCLMSAGLLILAYVVRHAIWDPLQDREIVLAVVIAIVIIFRYLTVVLREIFSAPERTPPRPAHRGQKPATDPGATNHTRNNGSVSRDGWGIIERFLLWIVLV